MNCDKKDKDCRLDIGRGCLFCGGEDGHGEASACVSEGCFKLHETDWLADYPVHVPTDIFEVRFKNTRRGYYKNIHDLPLKRGDVVAVESSPGHDIGIVSLVGDMVARQMKRTGFQAQNGEFRAIYRKAKPYDIEKWQQAIAMEHGTMIRSRQIAKELKLDMKIGDVEYQGDRIKAIFYYIADGRVDFRELIKVFASEFGIKVEMKQIGARQEAGRIGGLGSCGRELCCSSWVAHFNSVTTGAARTQDISLNPQKLAGQCCKLKCCLSYELDAYLDARKALPRVSEPLQALDGDYYLVSSDVLRGLMSFSTVKGSPVGGVVLPASEVREIMEMNRRGKKPDTIAGIAPTRTSEDEPSFVNMVGEESITRFDKNRGEGDKRRGRGGRGDGSGRNGSRDGRGRGNAERRNDGERTGNGERRNDGGNRQDGSRRPDGERRGEGSNRPNGDRQGERRDDRQRDNRNRGGGEGREEGRGVNRNRDNRGNRPRPPKSENSKPENKE
ncbi:MAG: hypothetical protein LBV18_02610 [Alistipes sp.]|nr:hypothetical protein [Alistipes sp.]